MWNVFGFGQRQEATPIVSSLGASRLARTKISTYPNLSIDIVGEEGGVCIEPAIFRVGVPPLVAQWCAAAAVL